MTTVETPTRTLTYRDAVNEALAIELERDPAAFLIGEDIAAYGGVYKVTAGLLERFGPERVIDTPIAEAGFVGAAIGAAIAGRRPIVELMFMDFALVALDQMLNQASKLRYLSGDTLAVPLTVRTQQGVGSGTAAQHSQSFEALFAHVPGFAVALPAFPADAKGLLAAAVRMDDPSLVIEHKALYATKGEVPEGNYVIPFGVANVLRRGADVTIVSYSRAVHTSLEAADILLRDHRVAAEVIDLRTVVPLDYDTVIESVERTGHLVVVHEAHRNVGIGAEIAARVSEYAWGSLKTPVRRVAGLDVPVPYSKDLEARWLPQPDDIVAVVLQSLAMTRADGRATGT
jgi:acetoin:2,6-dichlorophenolindophenol oxidoreductase subunit beta